MNKKKIVTIFSIIMPLFLLLLSYQLVLSFSNLTPAQENVFGFLAGREELRPGFTELEISHLEEVKQVMKSADYVFLALLLTVAVIITSHRKNTDFLLRLLKLGGKITVIIMLFLGLLTALSFDFMFSIFHSAFFPQGNWIFAPDSVIIQAFPLDFFITISRNIFLLTLFLGILFILSDYFY